MSQAPAAKPHCRCAGGTTSIALAHNTRWPRDRGWVRARVRSIPQVFPQAIHRTLSTSALGGKPLVCY
eukprot:6212316-Pleurochrysis_carterae.AAC.2